MKLSQLAIQKILDSKSLPKKIQEALGVSRVTIWRYIKDNDDELTKAAALKVIREETGLTDDEILEVEAMSPASASETSFNADND
jgi:predicted DNA-binding transcriptional regulator AlpA